MKNKCNHGEYIPGIVECETCGHEKPGQVWESWIEDIIEGEDIVGKSCSRCSYSKWYNKYEILVNKATRDYNKQIERILYYGDEE